MLINTQYTKPMNKNAAAALVVAHRLWLRGPRTIDAARVAYYIMVAYIFRSGSRPEAPQVCSQNFLKKVLTNASGCDILYPERERS